MIIGEAPGEQEDIVGKPFVGKAGKLLNEVMIPLDYMKYKIYITNVVKHRPPNNRPPTLEEKTICSTWLFKQIDVIKPKVILCLGRHALDTLSEKVGIFDANIATAQFLYNGIHVYSAYHPSYILRNNYMKTNWIGKLAFIKKELERICPI